MNEDINKGRRVLIGPCHQWIVGSTCQANARQYPFLQPYIPESWKVPYKWFVNQFICWKFIFFPVFLCRLQHFKCYQKWHTLVKIVSFFLMMLLLNITVVGVYNQLLYFTICHCKAFAPLVNHIVNVCWCGSWWNYKFNMWNLLVKAS